MFSDCATKLNYLMMELPTKITMAESNNLRKERMDKNRDDILTDVHFLRTKLQYIKEMRQEINIASQGFKDARRQFIEDEIQRAIDCVFDEDYKVKVDIRPYKNTIKAKLILTTSVNGEKVEINPNFQNGGLLRQVTASSAGLAIAKLLRIPLVLMDEAYNGGDNVTISRMQSVIKSYLDYDQNNQIILNEHNSALYTGLPVRVYELDKEGTGLTGQIKIVSMTDYEGGE